MGEFHNGLPCFSLLIVPKADTVRGNPGFRGNACCLNHDEPEATSRPSTIMHEVPVGRNAVFTSLVLAHWWEENAIFYSEPAESEGSKKGTDSHSLMLPAITVRRQCFMQVYTTTEPNVCAVQST